MRKGQPIAVPTMVHVKFRLQGNSAKPYIHGPPRASIPLRLPFDPVEYPLTVYPIGVGVGMMGSTSAIGGYEVMVDATLDRSSREASYRLTCTGNNRNCSIPRGGEYPARWLTDHSLEMIAETEDGEWRSVEYHYQSKPRSRWRGGGRLPILGRFSRNSRTQKEKAPCYSHGAFIYVGDDPSAALRAGFTLPHTFACRAIGPAGLKSASPIPRTAFVADRGNRRSLGFARDDNHLGKGNNHWERGITTGERVTTTGKG
jgi:hypothetical protein